MSQITSKPLERRTAPPSGGRGEATKAKSIHWDRVPLVLLGWLLFVLWWAAGGKYTIDGLPLLSNEIFAFFRAPFKLALIADWHWYLWLCWLPVVISLAERRYAPWRRLAWSFIMVWIVFVWAVVSGVDATSTYLAVTNPAPDAYLLSRQLAAIKPLAGLWSVATTFLPETGIAILWWWLRKG